MSFDLFWPSARRLFHIHAPRIMMLAQGPGARAATSRICTPVRSWTGRAAMSCSTSTPIAAFITAGTGKTRVSGMRAYHRIDSRTQRHGAIGPDTATLQRRNQGTSAHQPYWSG